MSAPAAGDGATATLRRSPAELFAGVGFSLSSLGFAVAHSFRAVLAPLEIAPHEFALLRGVGAAPGQTQHAVAQRLGVPPSRMVMLVDGLEQRGLLERRSKPGDRRARALHLTPSGRALLKRAMKRATDFEERLCRDLDEAQRGQLLELLATVRGSLGVRPGVHPAQAGVPPRDC